MALVLVVDDQASNRDLIVTLVRYAKHQPLEAADGHVALALVREHRPDLVICDLLMPTMDGYEFVRQLRADPAVAATTVVFYTANFMEREARGLADACGVSHILVKPCEPEDVLRVMAEALAHSGTLPPAPDIDSFDREHLRVLTDKLARKVEELEAANRKMSALTDMNLQLASERDPYRLLDKVCRGARELLGARQAMLAARDKTGNGATHLSTWGMPPDQAEQLRQQLDLRAGLLGQVMDERQARRFSQSDAPAGQPLLPPGFPACQHGLAVPVVSLHHCYGWILLIDKPGEVAFSEQDLDLLAIHAAQAGRIYENGSLYQQVQRSAEQLQLEIAERKAAAEELRIANETLELRVQQRTAQLRDIIDGLESFNRSVSHDLRGPLGGIAGAARMARGFIAEHRQDKAERFLDAIAEQAEQTGKMVDALLALARAGEAVLARQPVNAHEIVQQALNLLQPPDAPTLPVRVTALPPLDADPDLARQVFVNLIGNALKFASASTRPPEVHVGCLGAQAPPVFFVRDNGVGFDPGQAGGLFKAFHRLHGAEFEGSGVGLSIVKRIVDRHGGQVWAEGTPGQGATFYVHFGPRPG